MRIGIICGATDGGRSGISVYLKKLLEEIFHLRGNHEIVLFRFEEDTFLVENIQEPVETVFIHSIFQKPVFSILWHIFCLPFLSLYYSLDKVFLPAGNRRLSLWNPVDTITTVHDLSQLHIKGKYDAFRMFYVLRMLPFFMRFAQRIIAISTSTANDLMDFCHIPAENISLVYNGIDTAKFTDLGPTPQAREHLKNRYGIDGPYVLYVSRIEHPGKNHYGLVKAFNAMKNSSVGFSDVKLVFVGAQWPGSEPVTDLIEELSLGDSVILTGFADKEDLPLLYANAELFALPSYFEGFGLPLLEAMACGVPVICANTSSLPEVAGEAALLFNPDSTSEMTQALIKGLGDKLARDFLVEKGFAQVAKFHWENTARETLKVITQESVESERMESWKSGIVRP